MKRLFTTNDYKNTIGKDSLKLRRFAPMGIVKYEKLDEEFYRLNHQIYSPYFQEIELLKQNFRPFTKKAVL